MDARAIVINADSSIILSVRDPQYNGAGIYSDGVPIGELDGELEIRRSAFRLPLLTSRKKYTPDN